MPACTQRSHWLLLAGFLSNVQAPSVSAPAYPQLLSMSFCETKVDKHFAILRTRQSRCHDHCLLLQNKQLTNNDECKTALFIIHSIIDTTSTNCFVCNKETVRKDMKKCAACRSVCYCSEECQRKHWQRSHAQDCKTFIMEMINCTTLFAAMKERRPS